MSLSPYPAKPEKRSPFPKPSLPQAGESSRAALESFVFNKVMFWVILTLTMALFAVMEWWTYLVGRPPAPLLFTGAALLLAGVTVWRYFRVKPTIDAMKLGVRGERMIGHALEELRRDDYRIFHDIECQGDAGNFNIDHLLIGPGGVFVIETKTHSKPGKGRAEVHYDGERVRVDGFAPERDPVAQAAGQARFIADKLKKETSHQVDVRPVVVYPGWFVIGFEARHRVWVMNDKMLPAILRKQDNRLRREDVALYASRIETLLTQE